jgi:alkylhydroperoxidase family enzyme
MKNLYPPKVQNAVEALLHSPAVCTPRLRQAIEAYAARLSGGKRVSQVAAQTAGQEIPANLVAYVEKVARHAYKVTDQDIEQLKEAGYSEDAIFEITLCASMGASLARLERGLLALKGNSHAPPGS